jgi:hypothetical protein
MIEVVLVERCWSPTRFAAHFALLLRATFVREPAPVAE